MSQAEPFSLPAPGVMVPLSPAFNPLILKGLKVYPDKPFRFDFIIDEGDGFKPSLQKESIRLIKYFLTSLTVPENDLWVNLSPYEKDRIIPNSFGLTEMGRDLLAEDYMLKQITASLIYPENEIGKNFWKKVYAEAQKRFGTTDIPVNTFNKVWIVPAKAVIYENVKAGTVYVVESKLKVMLEQDYLSLKKHENVVTGHARSLQTNDVNALGSQVIRQIIIPALTKEVNEGKNFAQLRQVYNSIILAVWYKKRIKDSFLAQVYSDKNKVMGIDINDPQEKDKIYQRYLKAFKKGVYNYIKEDIDSATQEPVPRKYFSGGADFDHADAAMSRTIEVPKEQETLENVVSIEAKPIDPRAAVRTKEGLERVVSAILGVERDGKSIFSKEQAWGICRKMWPDKRIVFLRRIAEMKNEGRYLFNMTQLLRITAIYNVKKETVILAEIDWLLKFPGIGNQGFLFNGEDISRIVCISKPTNKKQELISTLVGLENSISKTPLLNAHDISKIFDILGSRDLGNDSKEAIVKLKESAPERTLSPYRTGLILKSASIKHSVFGVASAPGMDSVLSIQREGKSIFNKEQASRILYKKWPAERIIFLRRISEMKKQDQEGEYLFSVPQLLRINDYYNLSNEAAILAEIEWLSKYPGRENGGFFFKGEDITNIVYKNLPTSKKKELINALVGLMDGERHVLSATEIGLIVHRIRNGELGADLKNDLLKTKSEIRYRSLVGWEISRILRNERKYVLVPVIDHAARGKDSREKSVYLQRILNIEREGKAVFSIEQAKEISEKLAPEARVDFLIKITKIRNLQGAYLFNLSDLMRIICSYNEDDKRAIENIEALTGMSDRKDNKQILDGRMIALHFCDKDRGAEFLTWARYLKYFSQRNSNEPLFTVEQLRQILKVTKNVKEMRKIVNFLFIRVNRKTHERIFDGTKITNIILRTASFGWKNNIKQWFIKNSSKLTYKEMKWIYSFLTKTELDSDELFSLVYILFPENEQSEVLNGLERKINESNIIAEKVLGRDLENSDSSDAKVLLMSPELEIRRRTLGRIIAYVYTHLGHHMEDAAKVDAVAHRIEHYDWARPKAGLGNILYNARQGIKHIEMNSATAELPDFIKVIRKIIKDLQGKGLQETEIRNVLMKRGFNDFEINMAIRLPLRVEIDAPKGEYSVESQANQILDPEKQDFVYPYGNEEYRVTVDVLKTAIPVKAQTVGGALKAYWDSFKDPQEVSRRRNLLGRGHVKVTINGRLVKLERVLDESLVDVGNISISVESDNEEDPDPAQIVLNGAAKGGIDLSADKINLQLQKSDGEIKFHLNPAMIQRFQNTPGFVPVIINIRPMTNLRKFLEFSKNEDMDATPSG